MERRRILVIAAAIVAALGVVLVLLYVRGADQRAQENFESVRVLVAREQISTGESIDDALAKGKLESLDVVKGSLLSGYQTNTNALTGQFATQTIYPGEQIIAAKFSANATNEVTESLQLENGQQAVAINLSDTQRVAGFINPGSEVAVYFSSAGTVRMLLKRATVIGVGSTTPASSTNAVDADGNPIVTEALPRTLMTLALDQKDVQKLIFAQENGSTYFTLLNKDSKVDLGVAATQLGNLFN